MRLYNGCPDSELKAVWDANDKAERKLKREKPEAHCTYFPSPGFWQVYENYHPISGEHSNRIAAIGEALNHE